MAEAEVQKAVIEIKNSAQGMDQNGLCGYFLNGQVEAGTPGHPSLYQTPGNSVRRESWGCHDVPGGHVEVAERSIDVTLPVNGESLQIVGTVGAQWNYDEDLSVELKGRVINTKDHKPVKDAEITLTHQTYGKTFNTRSGADGLYSVKVPSGMYSVELVKRRCDTIQFEKEMCGWGPVNGMGERHSVYTQDIETACEEKARAGFSGVVRVDMGVSGAAVVEWHQIDIKLDHAETKPDGLFWEGLWRGTMRQAIVMNPGEQQVAHMQFTDIQQTPIEYNVEYYLEAAPGGGLSPNSYVHTAALNDMNTSVAGIAGYDTPHPVAVSGSSSSAGQVQKTGRDGLKIVEEGPDFIKVRPSPGGPPFADMHVPGVSVVCSNPAYVLIEREN